MDYCGDCASGTWCPEHPDALDAASEERGSERIAVLVLLLIVALGIVVGLWLYDVAVG